MQSRFHSLQNNRHIVKPWKKMWKKKLTFCQSKIREEKAQRKLSYFHSKRKSGVRVAVGCVYSNRSVVITIPSWALMLDFDAEKKGFWRAEPTREKTGNVVYMENGDGSPLSRFMLSLDPYNIKLCILCPHLSHIYARRIYLISLSFIRSYTELVECILWIVNCKLPLPLDCQNGLSLSPLIKILIT